MDNKTRAIKLECNCDACAGYYRCKNCGSMSIRHPFDYCPMCGKELEYDASDAPRDESNKASRSLKD